MHELLKIVVNPGDNRISNLAQLKIILKARRILNDRDFQAT